MNKEELYKNLLYRISQEIMTYHHYEGNKKQQTVSINKITEYALKSLRLIEHGKVN